MHLKTVRDGRKREACIYWLPPPTDQQACSRVLNPLTLVCRTGVRSQGGHCSSNNREALGLKGKRRAAGAQTRSSQAVTGKLPTTVNAVTLLLPFQILITREKLLTSVILYSVTLLIIPCKFFLKISLLCHNFKK